MPKDRGMSPRTGTMHATPTARPSKERKGFDVVAQHRGITHRTALTDGGSLALRCSPSTIVADRSGEGEGPGAAPGLAPALPEHPRHLREV